MAERLIIVAGALLNVLLMQAPLLLGDASFRDLMGRPPLVALLVLVTLHVVWEGSESRAAGITLARGVRGAVIPYLTGISLLLLNWILVVDFAFLGGASALSVRGGGGLILMGSLLMAGGVWVRTRSIRRLGPSFTSHICLIERHALARDGLYAMVRHPSETGMLMISLGACVVMSSSIGMFFVVLVLYPLSRLRVMHEDRMLRDSFGDEFDSYCRSTPAYLPRVVLRGGHIA